MDEALRDHLNWDSIMDEARFKRLDEIVKSGDLLERFRNSPEKLWAALRSCTPEDCRALAFACMPASIPLDRDMSHVVFITLDRNMIRDKQQQLAMGNFIKSLVAPRMEARRRPSVLVMFNFQCWKCYERYDEYAKKQGMPTLEEFVGADAYSLYQRILQADGDRSKKIVDRWNNSFPPSEKRQAYGRYGPYESSKV